MKNISIVIPIYKTQIEWNERVSLQQCVEVFKNRDIIFVYPNGLDISEYMVYAKNATFISLNPTFFKSIESYSLLLNSSIFYKLFLEYKYILIYQLDAYVFKDDLDYWCKQDYDYIGAPWIEADWIKELGWLGRFVYPVGNGGFSLRKVRTFYSSAKILSPVVKFLWRKKWNEDFFWSSLAHRLIPGFKVPNVELALKFAFEQKPSQCFQLNNYELPMGCHAWEKYEPAFWEKYIKR